MPLTHLLLAAAVISIWGINFICLKVGLEELSPLMLSSARFILASVPAIFFIKPPAVPFRQVILYGLTMLALQFLFLFFGMNAGVSPSLASLIMQLQVFFTLFYATVWWKEWPSSWQILGAIISFAGIGIVAAHVDNSMTILGVIMILGAAASWGLGNIISKSMGKVNMLALVVWGSFVASIPMTLLSIAFDGTDAIASSFSQLSVPAVMSVLFIAYGATLAGYGTWSWLLHRHPVSTVAPFGMLVPIVAMLSSALVLDEPLQNWKLLAGIFVISGLCVNLFGARLRAMMIRAFQPSESA